jgi:two-component system LytT family sensor kinase
MFIAWIIVIIIPFYLNYAFGGGDQHRLYQFYVHTISAVFIFYVGYLWLVPRFFLQNKKATYLIDSDRINHFNIFANEFH